jgi:hypothetical protein
MCFRKRSGYGDECKAQVSETECSSLKSKYKIERDKKSLKGQEDHPWLNTKYRSVLHTSVTSSAMEMNLVSVEPSSSVSIHWLHFSFSSCFMPWTSSQAGYHSWSAHWVWTSSIGVSPTLPGRATWPSAACIQSLKQWSPPPHAVYFINNLFYAYIKYLEIRDSQYRIIITFYLQNKISRYINRATF